MLPILLLTNCSSLSDLWLGDDDKESIPGKRVAVTHQTFYSEADQSYYKEQIHIPAAVNVGEISTSLGVDFTLYPNVAIGDLSHFMVSRQFNYISSRKFFNITSPLFVDDQLIILEPTGVLVSYNVNDGKKLWTNSKLKQGTNSGILSTSPNFYQGGMSYNQHVIYLTSGANSVLALDAHNGEMIWSKDLASPTRAVPIVSGGIVFIQTLDNSTYALEATSGKIIWTHYGMKTGVSTVGASAPIVKENVVLLQYNTGEIVALEALTGNELWALGTATGMNKLMHHTKFHSAIYQPILEGNMLISYNGEGVLSNVDLVQGKTLWEKDLELSKPFWMCGELLLAINDIKELIAINKFDGRVKWRTNLVSLEDNKSKDRTVWAGPLVANGKVIAVNSKGKLFEFDINSGHKISEREVIKDIFISPIIVDAKLYLISSNGKIIQYS